MITIAIDAMGGDHGPSVTIPAALNVLQRQPDLKLILVGDQAAIKQQLHAHQVNEHPRLSVHHTSQQVEMNESPAVALRTKKDSSMRVAINLVKTGQAQACVSAGNTGALMATARFVLKTLPGVDRPAIIAKLPTVQEGRYVRVLDLGANVDTTAKQLVQFAVMGSVLVAALEQVNEPKVALLNIGQEEIKGNEQVKQTAQLLADNPVINYIGYVEGDNIYQGTADVVVCDGFVGNVMLKTSEGLAKLFAHYTQAAFKRNFLTKLSGLIALHVLKRIGKSLDPARYNGATLLGLNGIIIKSHGSAHVLAYANAIEEAMMEVKYNVPQKIRDQVAHLLQTLNS